jgi:hypothetical protein
VQHAAERELFVAEELAAANGPIEMVARPQACLSSPATQFALIRHAIPFWLYGFSHTSSSGTVAGQDGRAYIRPFHAMARSHTHKLARAVPFGKPIVARAGGQPRISSICCAGYQEHMGKIDSRIGELRTLRRRLQTDDDRIEPDIVKHAELSQQVMRLTTIISDSVKKRPRASGASR